MKRFAFIASSLLLWACDPGAGQRQDPGRVLVADGESKGAEPAGSKTGFFSPTSKKRLYFGDLHVHTSYSLDAFLFGERTGPDGAYAYARKLAPSTATDGTKRWIDRPLDFAAATDHSEFYGIMYRCLNDAKHHAYCKLLAGLPWGDPEKVDALGDHDCHDTPQKLLGQASVCDDYDCSSAAQMNMWKLAQKAANDAYVPGVFTTFNAYEWSESIQADGTRHRNVIFKSHKVPAQVFDSFRYNEPIKLWKALQASCKTSDGCDVVAIPHNSNGSNGTTFALGDAQANRLRARYEPVVELFQGKGNSECLSKDPKDPSTDCRFELLLKQKKPTAEDWAKMRKGYVRTALLAGLGAYQKDKLNPLQLGFIGATDTHNANPGAVDESSWEGNHGIGDVTAKRRLQRFAMNNPGGLTAVWAEKNTREAIFAAIKRREVYATSGPRISLRFYATSASASCRASSAPSEETAMGGTMAKPVGKPTFYISAAKDQTPLASIELIRGTVERNGQTHEQVIPVVQNRRQSTLCHVYRDDDFDPALPTFWYVRVKQVPTPRWSKHDCKREPAACTSELNVDVQERAWSSPIWYHPKI
jgi:hypothetical protein